MGSVTETCPDFLLYVHVEDVTRLYKEAISSWLKPFLLIYGNFLVLFLNRISSAVKTQTIFFQGIHTPSGSTPPYCRGFAITLS
jgi:hypothetical protein